MKKPDGFTLIELSIVLVIIGLVVGGILAGNTLIQAAYLRSVIKDKNFYSVAVATFITKYNALPGDMDTATTLWGTASGGCPGGAGTGTQTCNGNGKGSIYDYAGGGDSYEMFRAWQHLSNANLIPGKYTGVAGASGPTEVLVGTNSPESSIQGAGYSIFYLGNFTYDGQTYTGNYGHLLLFGKTLLSIYNLNGALTPQDAMQVDLKIDDGKPGTGIVAGPASSSAITPNCTTTADPQTATYNLAYKSVACPLYLKMGF